MHRMTHGAGEDLATRPQKRRPGRGLRAALSAFFVLLLVVPAVEAGFAFRKQITIDGAQVVGGPHVDFPVLFAVEDPDLRSVANGGNVQSASGFDIEFRAADGTTVLDWEVEWYNPTTGRLSAWVRFPGTVGPPDTRIQNGVSTVFYVYYGDPTIGCCQTKHGNVWDANYRFVLHLGEFTGNPVDATSNGVGSRVDPNGEGVVIFRGEMASPTGSVAWDLATDLHPTPWTPPPAFQPNTDTYLSVVDGTILANSSFTVEAWFYMDTLDPGFVGIVTKNRDSGVDWIGLFKSGAPQHFLNLGWQCCAPNRPGNLNGPSLTAGQWYHAVATYDGATSTRRLYVYGTQVATDTVGAQYTNLTLPTRVGDDSNGNYIDGRVDEIRISNIARSPSWIDTTARNQACASSSLPWACATIGLPITTPFLAPGAQQAVATTFTPSDCCKVATSTGGTTLTVQTSDVRMAWDTAFGAGLSELYSEEEANAATNRRGDSARYNVFTAQVDDGAWHFERDAAGTLQVVEASPARVRLRQLYDFTAQIHLDRIWTVSPYPRLAISSTEIFDAPISVRGASGLHPKGEATCSNQTFGSTFFCAGRADGTNLLWLVTDNDNTYDDMLAILETDPCAGRGPAGCTFQQASEAGTPNTYYARTWEAGPPQVIPAGSYVQRTLFYPRLAGLTSTGPEWQPYANDHRNPDPISPVTGGSGWFDANELTSSPSDFYNEAEAAYLFDMNLAGSMSFDLDGGTNARLRPFFKVRQWHSMSVGMVTREAAVLRNGVDYTAAIKPISRAYSCPTAACATSTARANGGLAGATEFLADASPARNFTLDLSGTNHLYFGSDSRFRGLNVLLATAGAGTGLDLQWDYWNGATWASLEGVAGFTDQTANFTRGGTVFWTADPGSWAKRTLVAGDSLPLFWVRVSRVAGSYTTNPVEAQIKTDILLFQYCGDVTVDFETFTFFAPVPTAVKLMEFTALGLPGAVDLGWRTGSELDNLGFHLHRAPSAEGPWTRITPSLIPGLGTSPLGASYSWRDEGLVNGQTYFYRLEDVDTASVSTFHGPVSAVPETAPAEDGDEGSGDDGGDDGAGESGPGDDGSGDTASGPLPACTSPASALPCVETYGDPSDVSIREVKRTSRHAVLELQTGGFEAVHEPDGRVWVRIPGFEDPEDPRAPALPFKRVMVDAPVGKAAQVSWVRERGVESYPGLVPSAVGYREMDVRADGTVRPGRRAAQLRATRGDLVPRRLARLGEASFVGESKHLPVELFPVRYDGARGGVRLSRRLRVRVEFGGREAKETGQGSRGRRNPRKRPGGGEAFVYLHTTQKGLYGVPFEALLPGRTRGLSLDLVKLQRRGESVPFHVEPSRTSFGPGSVLYFYVDREAESTSYSGEVVYELVRASGGTPMQKVSASPYGDPLTTPSVAPSAHETNRIYQSGLLDAEDLWQWENLVGGVSKTKSVELEGVDPTSPRFGRVVVWLQGASDAESVVDHHIEVLVNGTFVGETVWDGKLPHRFEAEVAASRFHEGTNDLTVRNAGDTGVYSLVFLDRFRVEYPQQSALRGGVFEGEWSEEGIAQVALSGGTGGPGLLPVIPRALSRSTPEGSTGTRSVAGTVSSLAAVDVTDSAQPLWLVGLEPGPGSVRLRAESGRRYVLASPEGVLTPRISAPVPTSLRSPANQADYILITPQAFVPAAQALLERRESQGLRTKVATLEEITSAFGHGEASGEAIQAFLTHAYQEWRRPSPRYVVLLGDGSHDPRNFIGTSGPAPLPVLFLKTSYLVTASDPAMAAVNGDDLLPDLAIGRLPAQTAEQAQSLVEKLLAWEDSGQGLSGNAVLVADNPDEAGDFEADIADVRDSFLGSHDPQTILLRQEGANTRAKILEAFDAGASFVSYAGHGGAAVWASENVLNSWDVASLQAQSEQPVMLTLNCLNGYFVAPSFDSLGEAYLKAQGRGTIAAFSPSGLSLDGPAHQFHRALMSELTSGSYERLGDAVLAAQESYAQTGMLPELLSVYHLLGDPGMVIRP